METRNPKLEVRTNQKEPTRRFDLGERTCRFAQDIRRFVKTINHTISNIEDAKQLVRASGSVGANYIEANEAMSRKDFLLRVKICRKEAQELTNIFGAIVRKTEV